jgi:two-component system LytT family response regulator
MKTPLNTLIVDDEARTRRMLSQRLQRSRECRIVAEASNGKEALAMLRRLRPELLFLDVQMPVMDGFDVLRAMSPKELPLVVFLTTQDHYAISVFEQHGLDYLLKPIAEDRLVAALEHVRENCGKTRLLRQRRLLNELIRQITSGGGQVTRGSGANGQLRPRRGQAPRLAIRDAGRTNWIRQEDIDWIDAAGDYMCVHAGGETYIMRQTMKKLEQELDPSLLQRVHRSTIVNVHRVQGLAPHINGEYFLKLSGGHTIKLSRTYKDKLRFFA